MFFLKALRERFRSPRRQVNDYKFLPQRHWFAHDYCMMIHDLLAQVVVEGEKAGIFNIKITDESGDLIEKLKANQEHDLITFLEKEERFGEIFMLLYKQVCVAIVSDMTHFIYEALQCSKKGKLTVTFSLLRKPLVENLLYLEYLLTDPGAFIINFWKGEIDHFGLGQRQEIDALAIVKLIYEKYPLPQFEDAEFIHDIRYKKDSHQSFQTYFQKATHLVTQARSYKTENTNFNFIYSDAETHEIQWDGLYSYLPIVLFHAYQVIEALLKIVRERSGKELDITDGRVAVGYILWEKFSHWGKFGEEDVLDRLIEILDLARFSCVKCNSKIISSEKNYLLFYEHGHLICDSCGKDNDLISPFLKFSQTQLRELDQN